MSNKHLTRIFHKPDRHWRKAFQPEAVVIYLVPAKLKERRRMRRLNNTVPESIRKARRVKLDESNSQSFLYDKLYHSD